jgi:hypothetical protein
MTDGFHRGTHRLAGLLATLAAALTITMTGGTIASAQAMRPPQSAPWCANMGGTWGFDCSYFTFEQCMETARGLGNSCSPNPNFIPPPTTRARGKQKYYVDQWGRYYVDRWGRQVRVR